MQLKLKKSLIIFDIESTGVNVEKDRIVEIALLKINVDNQKEELLLKINPTIPIPVEVSKVHGIYDKDVIDCLTFKEASGQIADFIGDSDLGGFNSNRFDIPLLVEEFARVGKLFDLEIRNCIDIQNIYHQKEKRNLSAAYKFYCDKELIIAHSASADMNATYEIFLGQIDKYQDIPRDIEKIAEEFNYNNTFLDISKRFMKTPNGVVLCFGKHKDKTIEQIAKEDPNYFNWIYNNDFGFHTKIVLETLCQQRNIKLFKR